MFYYFNCICVNVCVIISRLFRNLRIVLTQILSDHFLTISKSALNPVWKLRNKLKQDKLGSISAFSGETAVWASRSSVLPLRPGYVHQQRASSSRMSAARSSMSRRLQRGSSGRSAVDSRGRSSIRGSVCSQCSAPETGLRLRRSWTRVTPRGHAHFWSDATPTLTSHRGISRISPELSINTSYSCRRVQWRKYGSTLRSKTKGIQWVVKHL